MGGVNLFKKRILRVGIPYIIWTFIYTIPNFSLFHLARNLVTAEAAPNLYYIFVYIQFVLLTPLPGKLAKSDKRWLGWLVSPVSIILFKYIGLFTGTSLNTYVSLLWGDSCLGWFTYYYLGLLLGNNLITESFNIKTLFALFLVSLPLQIAEGYGWFQLGVVNCGSQLKLISLLTSSLFLLVSYCYIKDDRIRFTPKVLSFIGDYSFGIYLIWW